MNSYTLEELETRFKQKLLEVEQQRKTVIGQKTRMEMLETELGSIQEQIAAERLNPKRIHIERINELVESAKQSLIEAGKIAQDHSLTFTFITPKGNVEPYLWQHSSCYGEDAWYNVEEQWQSSSYGC